MYPYGQAAYTQQQTYYGDAGAYYAGYNSYGASQQHYQSSGQPEQAPPLPEEPPPVPQDAVKQQWGNYWQQQAAQQSYAQAPMPDQPPLPPEAQQAYAGTATAQGVYGQQPPWQQQQQGQGEQQALPPQPAGDPQQAWQAWLQESSTFVAVPPDAAPQPPMPPGQAMQQDSPAAHPAPQQEAWQPQQPADVHANGSVTHGWSADAQPPLPASGPGQQQQQQQPQQQHQQQQVASMYPSSQAAPPPADQPAVAQQAQHHHQQHQQLPPPQYAAPQAAGSYNLAPQQQVMGELHAGMPQDSAGQFGTQQHQQPQPMQQQQALPPLQQQQQQPHVGQQQQQYNQQQPEGYHQHAQLPYKQQQQHQQQPQPYQQQQQPQPYQQQQPQQQLPYRQQQQQQPYRQHQMYNQQQAYGQQQYSSGGPNQYYGMQQQAAGHGAYPGGAYYPQQGMGMPGAPAVQMHMPQQWPPMQTQHQNMLPLPAQGSGSHVSHAHPSPPPQAAQAPTHVHQGATPSAGMHPVGPHATKPVGPHATGGVNAAAVKQSLEALRPVVELASLLRGPGRRSRPPRMLLVLRGLPGSGKSYLAKRIREVEVEEGGEAPRVHALDDYFMTEVEKEVEGDEAGGTRGGRGRKQIVTVVEYQYDASMEEAYRKSLVKAVSKTLEEGRYPLVIMDAPNIANAHWLDVLPACTKHRYAVYVLQPLETDPALCAKRNTHGHSMAHVASLAAAWEAPPSLPAITLMDARTLLQGQLQGASHIDEVEMDDEEEAADQAQDATQEEPAAAAAAGDNSAANGGAGHAAGSSKRAAGGLPGKPSASLTSRWLQQDEQEAGQHEQGSEDAAPTKKRARIGGASVTDLISDQEILQGINSALGPNGTSASSKPGLGRAGLGAGGSKGAGAGARRGILRSAAGLAGSSRRGGGGPRRRVRWCDQPGDAEDEAVAGFRIQPRIQPLAEVHVIEGLGPAKGDTALQYMDASSPLISGRHISFAEQVKAEHSSEHELLAHLHDHLDDLDEE